MQQLNAGVQANKVVFEKKLAVVQNRSVDWLVNGYEAINKCEIVEKVSYLLKYSQSSLLNSYFRHSNFVQQERGVLTSLMSA